MKHARNVLLLRLTLPSAVVALLGACFLPIHIRTRVVNPSFPRARLCVEAVSVFHAPAEVKKDYVAVAELIAPPGGAEYMPDPRRVLRAQQEKAAQLGANGLIVERHQSHGYDDALAIFIPEDSVHALSVCDARHGVR